MNIVKGVGAPLTKDKKASAMLVGVFIAHAHREDVGPYLTLKFAPDLKAAVSAMPSYLAQHFGIDLLAKVGISIALSTQRESL